MTKDEVLRLALEALKEDRAWLETDAPTEVWEKNNEAIIAVEAALLSRSDGEAKDEPVEQPKVRTGNCLRVGVCASEGYKIQPQRTWVGLTDEHKDGLICMTDPNPEPHHLRELIDVVEFQLKGKNT